MDAKKPLRVDVTYVEPNLIDVAREEHALGIRRPGFLPRDEVPHWVGGDLVEQPVHLAFEDRAHALLATRDTRGFRKHLEQGEVHARQFVPFSRLACEPWCAPPRRAAPRPARVDHFAGCSFKSCWISSSAMTEYAVTRTGLSSMNRFSPAQLPSGFCRLASLFVSSTRQSCFTPLESVMNGSSYAFRALAIV